MKSFLRFFVGLTLAGAVSCNGTEESIPNNGKDYFPVRKGLFQVYDVERTVYTLGVPETFVYELKTVVVDSFLNTEGYYSYVIHRSTRFNDLSEWEYLDTWSMRDAASESVMNEANLLTVKLRYPVNAGLQWDGNLYNNRGEDEYEIESLGGSLTYNDMEFKDCLTVNQNNNEDFIVFLDQRKEIFARGVGLIYKDSTWLKYCTNVNCLGQQVVEEGVVYKQTIKAYGRE